jgi:hypothetical protein
MTGTKDMNKAAKKIDSLAKAINRYCYQLENPHRSDKLRDMIDQFNDMKEDYIEQGIWMTVCEMLRMNPSANGADCAA